MHNTRTQTRLHTQFLPIIAIFYSPPVSHEAAFFALISTSHSHLMHALFRSPPLCPFILPARPPLKVPPSHLSSFPLPAVLFIHIFFLHSLPPVSSPAGRQHVNYVPQMQIFPGVREDLRWRQNIPSFQAFKSL